MDIFTFGRYKGEKVLSVCRSNPRYCLWAHANVPFFSLTEEQKKMAERRVDEIEDAKAEWAEDVYGFGGNGLWDT